MAISRQSRNMHFFTAPADDNHATPVLAALRGPTFRLDFH